MLIPSNDTIPTSAYHLPPTISSSSPIISIHRKPCHCRTRRMPYSSSSSHPTMSSSHSTGSSSPLPSIPVPPPPSATPLSSPISPRKKGNGGCAFSLLTSPIVLFSVLIFSTFLLGLGGICNIREEGGVFTNNFSFDVIGYDRRVDFIVGGNFKYIDLFNYSLQLSPFRSTYLAWLDNGIFINNEINRNLNGSIGKTKTIYLLKYVKTQFICQICDTACYSRGDYGENMIGSGVFYSNFFV